MVMGTGSGSVICQDSLYGPRQTNDRVLHVVPTLSSTVQHSMFRVLKLIKLTSFGLATHVSSKYEIISTIL